MNNPAETISHFNADNGVPIFYRHRPAVSERARLVLAHGLGEHSGRYSHVIERLSESGISVWALDHQGHGESRGKRGHIDRFGLYLDDLKHLAGITSRNKPQKMKTFLLGHSMGGLMALRFAELYPDIFDGLIASSPGLAPAMKIPLVKGSAAKLISNIWPSLSFDNELDPSQLSHDQSVVQAYVDDPLVHRWISARWFTEFLSAMGATMSGASAIRVPVLMQVAGADRIVAPTASKQFFEMLTTTDKTLFYYDGLYHEIYNESEPDREKVLNDLAGWLENHI